MPQVGSRPSDLPAQQGVNPLIVVLLALSLVAFAGWHREILAHRQTLVVAEQAVAKLKDSAQINEALLATSRVSLDLNKRLLARGSEACQ